MDGLLSTVEMKDIEEKFIIVWFSKCKGAFVAYNLLCDTVVNSLILPFTTK